MYQKNIILAHESDKYVTAKAIKPTAMTGNLGQYDE